MKKAIATLGISAATLIVSSTDTSAQETAKVIAEALNMRTGPGINYSKLGTIQKDSTVTILEKSKGWVKIKASSGKIAWVSGQYLKASSNIEESDSSYSNTESGYMAYVSVSSSLNVRSSASTSSSVITSLKNNTRVQVIEKSNNGWTKIKTDNGQIGWVSSKYIVSSPSSGNTSSQEESEIISGNLKINVSSGLNVRKGPGTNYSVIGSLSGGSIVKAKEKSNGWYKIETANGVEGWISGKYVTSTNEPLTGSTSSNSNNQGNNNDTSYGNGETSATGDKIVDYAYTLLGVPYKWGGNGPSSFDCSGYTQWVYRNAAGINIPRVSRDQAQSGSPVSRGDYKKGDLLYFDTSGNGSVSHVGIYIGGDKFIHCSGTQSKPGCVKVSSLSGFYANALLGARRFV